MFGTGEAEICIMRTLEVRNSFEIYIDKINGPQEREEIPFLLETPCGEKYYGIELRYPMMKVVVYFFQLEEDDEYIMFLYLDENVLDEFAKHINKYNLPGTKKAYPLIIEALTNGIHENYSDFALIKLKNMTCETNPFWCVATKLENISEIDINNPYIARKYSKLFNATREMFRQLLVNKTNWWETCKMYLWIVADIARIEITLTDTLAKIPIKSIK